MEEPQVEIDALRPSRATRSSRFLTANRANARYRDAGRDDEGRSPSRTHLTRDEDDERQHGRKRGHENGPEKGVRRHLSHPHDMGRRGIGRASPDRRRKCPATSERKASRPTTKTMDRVFSGAGAFGLAQEDLAEGLQQVEHGQERREQGHGREADHARP